MILIKNRTAKNPSLSTSSSKSPLPAAVPQSSSAITWARTQATRLLCKRSRNGLDMSSTNGRKETRRLDGGRREIKLADNILDLLLFFYIFTQRIDKTGTLLDKVHES